MTKKEAKFILESLNAPYSSLAETLFSFGPDSDPNFQCHCESDGPYTGDQTYEFGMELVGMALDAFTAQEIEFYGYADWRDRWERYDVVVQRSIEFHKKKRA